MNIHAIRQRLKRIEAKAAAAGGSAIEPKELRGLRVAAWIGPPHPPVQANRRAAVLAALRANM